MPVSSLQGLNVPLAALAGIDQIAAPPGKAWLLEQVRQHDVGHQASMAAIAIGKGMNGGKPVMEAHGNLVRRIDSMGNPGGAVLAEGTQFGGYLPGRQADVLAGLPVYAGPAPDIPEHPFMQPAGKAIRENIRLGTTESPSLGLGDVLLLHPVQFGAGGIN